LKNSISKEHPKPQPGIKPGLAREESKLKLIAAVSPGNSYKSIKVQAMEGLSSGLSYFYSFCMMKCTSCIKRKLTFTETKLTFC
jgi:hypothetical protein